MNKQDYNRVVALYNSGGVSESMVVEIIVNKTLSEVPGVELEHFVMQNAIKQIAAEVDTFYKMELIDKKFIYKPTDTKNGQ